MSYQEQHNLTSIINARGTYTPLGVSRSSSEICTAVTEALSNFIIIDEFQELASQTIASYSGSQAATVTHCVASGITVSIAATMTGVLPDRIASLPDSTGMPNCVVIPSGHCVNYGHPLLQAIRLAGAKPILAGTEKECSLEDIKKEIENNEACCLFLVSSKLVKSTPIDFNKAVTIAHQHNIPVIIDGAAQDFRIRELVATNADMVLISAQKYLNSPTAGLVIGKKRHIDAVRAQEHGIGRGMKATKESIAGVLAAIEERKKLDINNWKQLQDKKIADLVQRLDALLGVDAHPEKDPTGLPFSRVILKIDSSKTSLDASRLVAELKSGTPSIWVMDQNVGEGEIGLELVQINSSEIELLFAKLVRILNESQKLL